MSNISGGFWKLVGQLMAIAIGGFAVIIAIGIGIYNLF